jgi:hypothetical protein
MTSQRRSRTSHRRRLCNPRRRRRGFRMTMKAILTVVALIAACECSQGQNEYAACAPTNAVWSLQAEVVVPDFPHAEHLTWHFRPTDSNDTFRLSGLPMFLPGTHSRQKDWRLSLVPKAATFETSNLVYQVTWQVKTFGDGRTSTNSTVLTMPMGRDFMTNAGDLVVTGKWNRLKVEPEVPCPRPAPTRDGVR